MALATRGTNFCKPDVVRYEWELAKELGINITVHVAMDRFGYTKMQLTALREHGPAVPEHHVHPLVASARRGVGHGPRLRRQRLAGAADRAPDGPRLGARGRRPTKLGIPVGLWSDVATTASADQFTQMHAIFASERAPRHQVAWDEDLDGNEPTPDLITSRQVLRWATLDGAQGRRRRRPHRLDHARQEGRPRDHRRLRR